MFALMSHLSKAVFRLSRILTSTTGVNSMSTKSVVASGVDSCSGMEKNCIQEEKQDYESAVLKLNSLVSNTEILAINRLNRNLRRKSLITNIGHFITRSGLKEDDVEKMSMIHVSGTKGKGSTSAFCERILNSRGYKTGLFSSPHMIEVRERIRINGRPVSKELYAHYFWKVYNNLYATKDDYEEKMPAFFAFNMVLSLHIFLAEGVDVSIMEVGIGGQYDSTNFIRRPAVCGVTSLGLDHTSILGHTLEEIAWNKAGIFKVGCPAIVVNNEPAAMKVILDRAKERQSALYVAASIEAGVLEKENIQLGISGEKQRDNAGLAVQLATMWEQRHGKDGMKPLACNVLAVTHVDDIPVLRTTRVDSLTAKGLSSCEWPGRAQVVKRPEVTYYLDGAHTRESIQVCSDWFRNKADEERKSINGKVVRVLIFNVTGERKPGPLLEILKDKCDFDAAGFCTNTVSTVESFNKKDQVNPLYTCQDMLEKAEANRICWQDLTSSSSSGSTTIANGNSRFSSEGSKKQKLDSSSATSDLIPAAAISKPSPNVSASPEIISSRNYASSSSSSSSSSNLNGSLINGHHSTTEFCEKNSSSIDNNDNYNDINKDKNANYRNAGNCSFRQESSTGENMCNNNNNNGSSNCVMQDIITKEEEKDFSSSTQEENHSYSNSSLSLSSTTTPQPSPPPSSSSSSSCSFRCVLQALTWATQAKDETVTVKDPVMTHLPTVPIHLAGADHVQVLVTGSLHLVGAVLGVMTPDMND